MTQPALLGPGAQDDPARPTGFLTLHQDPETRAYRVIGRLDRIGGNYLFCYAESVAIDPDGPLLPGFPERERRYESRNLFATFANRVMTPRRDSYRHHLQMLGLAETESPEPFEVLARTWGSRATDLIQLLPIPRVDATGALTTRFLVHGGRYVDPQAEHLRRVRIGERLGLLPEPSNPQDPSAVLVLEQDTGGPLGYIPGPLTPFIHHLWAIAPDIRVVAEHVNLPDDRLASNQMRLLVRLETVVAPDFDVVEALDIAG